MLVQTLTKVQLGCNKSNEVKTNVELRTWVLLIRHASKWTWICHAGLCNNLKLNKCGQMWRVKWAEPACRGRRSL